MKKNKIMAIILSGAMVASMASATALTKARENNSVNTTVKNNILLANPNQTISNNACVINGNGNLTLTNKDGVTTSKEITVTVKAKEVVKLPAPVISGSNITINVNSPFSNYDLNVSATEGAKLDYSGTVNTSTPGSYQVTVTATNSQGTTSIKTFTVKVEDTAPTLTASSFTMIQGGSFDISDLQVNAQSAEGQNLTSQVKITSGSVDVNKPGTYDLTLSVTDQYGETSTANVIVTVTVKAKQAEWQWVNKAEGIGTYQGQTYYTVGSAMQQMVNQDMFNDINTFRAQNGKKAYIQDQAAQYMATWKANNCIKYGYMEHIAGGSGNPYAGLYTNQVFSPQTKYDGSAVGFGSWCENLGQSMVIADNSLYNNTGIFAIDSSQVSRLAQLAVNAFIDSPLHRANLLSNNTYMGVDINIGKNVIEGTPNIAGTVAMDAYTPAEVGGTMNPVTWKMAGQHPLHVDLTAPSASAAQTYGQAHPMNGVPKGE